MNSLQTRYALAAVLATLAGYLFVPAAFAAGLVSMVAFGLIAIGCIVACNRVELSAWRQLGVDKAQSVGWRLAVRLGIYFLVPALIIYLIGSLVPGLLLLPFGFRSALALTFFPIIAVGSWLNLLPAR